MSSRVSLATNERFARGWVEDHNACRRSLIAVLEVEKIQNRTRGGVEGLVANLAKLPVILDEASDRSLAS